MNSFHFAIASIVDANTGNGLAHTGGSRNYAASAQHGREIRAKSILNLITRIKSGIASVIGNYRVYTKKRRDLRELMQLNNHLLEDIGLHRSDLYSVQLGVTTLEELKDRRQSGNHELVPRLEEFAASNQLDPSVAASNEAQFDRRKCA